MNEYIELDRIRGHAPSGDPQAQKTATHLQRCLLSLEKIKGIVGPGSIADLCDTAIMNKSPAVGGTVDV